MVHKSGQALITLLNVFMRGFFSSFTLLLLGFYMYMCSRRDDKHICVSRVCLATQLFVYTYEV